MSKPAGFYSNQVRQKQSLALFILAMVTAGVVASAQEFTEEERLLGFAQQQRRNAEADREREAGASSVKRTREEWEKDRLDSVGEYKRWKAQQKAALDERSDEYREDQEVKKQRRQDHEKMRAEYVRERDRERARRKQTVLLTEEHEYGLDEKVDRAEIRKRALYHPNLLKSVGKLSGRPGSSSGSTDFGGGGFSPNNPPPDFNPPVSAAPTAPEFFEPEIPPPPPPVDFDDSVPPPIFDDPGEF